ncbi:MAG: hypothetical protein NC079_09600 [Clostridium sp.]|nr:hypothetical protein [Acetatifactor muris]MCM1527606.1 hypothetical protein [Bacteroides sp.]MCM1563847.1 hypothetical protein [Clostridium sp.]
MGKRVKQSGRSHIRHRIRQPGSVANILVTGIFILAMAVVMMAFLEDVELIQQKAEVDQLARRYILRMETTGGLTPEDREELLRELSGQGITGADLTGTTLGESGYGAKIVLQIRGLLGGKYEFEERRVSTAKY